MWTIQNPAVRVPRLDTCIFRRLRRCLLAKRLIHRGIFIPQHAGNQPRDRIQNHRCGQFAAGEYKIAN